MLVHHPVAGIGGQAVVPRPFGVDDRKRPAPADAQAVRRGADNLPVGPQRFEPLPQVLEAVFAVPAVAAGAEDNVPRVAAARGIRADIAPRRFVA